MDETPSSPVSSSNSAPLNTPHSEPRNSPLDPPHNAPASMHHSAHSGSSGPRLNANGVPMRSDVVKVSATSRSTAVAGAIAGIVREKGQATVQAIGAGAVNQAMKATAIARGYLLLDGINVIVIPSFSDILIDGVERTAVRLTVEPR